MSIEASLDKSGECGPVANLAGWAALCAWVETVPLEECEGLDHLCTYGCTIDLDDFEAELLTLIGRADLPEGVGDVLAAILAAVKLREAGDKQLDVSDGVE